MIGQVPKTDLRTRPSIPSKRLEVGSVIGYIPRIAGRPTGKVIKAEVLEIGGMIGRGSVRVKLLDPQDIAANGGNLTAIISQFDVRQNPYVEESVNEGVNHPALQGWDEMDQRQKRDALQAAGIVDSYDTLNKTPSQLDDILHAARVKAQNQEDELNIGASGRRELQRQAKQDFEEQRQQLHKEKMEMERFAWEKANTEAERKHEITKIDKEYTQELRKLQMSHMQDMEKILHADTHELNKMRAEFNMRQAEREQVKPRPQRPRPQPQNEPEDERGDNFDQDTGEPINPSNPQTWHTNQQVGSDVKDDEDDIEDVESRPFTPYTPRPGKPMALNAPKRESRFSEAGRYGSNNPDTMSPNNYDRYQQDQMDQGKRDFKRREHEHEWEQEKAYTKQLQAQDRGPWYIRIDGKIYRQGGQPKSFDWKKGANNYALAMVKNNPSLQGKVMLSKNGEDK
jgi:hypothetical protein